MRLNETVEKVAVVVRKIQNEFRNFDSSTEKVLKDLSSTQRYTLQTRVNVLGRTLDRGAESLDAQEKIRELEIDVKLVKKYLERISDLFVIQMKEDRKAVIGSLAMLDSIII